ncbi:helix-turn-helix domain-containing protein [Bacillus kwashiorkori]|uniref:AlbA family DNA-binding domain-containing protein n=1 Tax=Bacillus kwashiorkori TaxID=1522318 RepID=UPI00078537A7|nr:ATP-binding protein [Bacillus kwashiorkori]
MENENSLYREIKILIASKREGEYWDFKEKYHKNKADLLHDIICMANNRADKDGYIIFGISDDYEIKGLEDDENRKNQQNIIDFLKGKKFSGGIRPTIELVSLPMGGKEIDVLIVKNGTDTPYFLIEDYNDGKRRVRANYIYTRIGDTNTDIDKSADINHIEYLWKKRFLLNRPPLEQIKQRLRVKSEWNRNDDEFYNIYNPEYTVALEYDDEIGHPEFYSYLMMNPSTSYGMLKVKYFGTTLYNQQFVILDSGRYITVVPEWGLIGDRYTNGDSYYYKFYVKDSMNHILHEFLLSEDHEAVFARNRLYSGVLIYQSDLEKEMFEDYLDQNLSLIHQLVEVEKEHDSFDWLETEGKREKIVNQERIIIGKVFNNLLEKFRYKISSTRK